MKLYVHASKVKQDHEDHQDEIIRRDGRTARQRRPQPIPEHEPQHNPDGDDFDRQQREEQH